MSRTTARRLSLLLILLLATGLRFYRLDAQSFWNDEGNSARAAERPIPLVLAAAAGDIHPPGYYLLLHFWRALAGESEFALRALSALCGVLTIAFTYALGRRLLGIRAGLGAAFLGAVSPLAIYYAQEARMYALLGLLAAAATYWMSPRPARWPDLAAVRPWQPAYVLTAAAGLYAHYAFPFVLAAHNLLFLGWWGVRGRREPRRWRMLLAWGALQAAALLLFLPWLPTALRSVTGWPSAGRTGTTAEALLDVLRSLAAGITLETAGPALWALLLAGGILLAGLWPRRGRVTATALLATWLLLPIGLLLALDLYQPAYRKFLLAVLPPFCLLLAAGIERVSQIGGRRRTANFSLRFTLYAVILVAIILPSLHNLYFDPAYAREDYRRIAAEIEQAAMPGDGIILNAANQWEVFTYYHRAGAPVYPVPRSRPPRADQVAAELESIAAAHQRLLVLYWGDAESDPERLVESWLATHAYPAGARWVGAVRVAAYGLASLPDRPAVPLEALFGESIRLQGCAVGEGPFEPGQVVPVTLFWQAEGPIAERYKLFLHLLDGNGSLVAQTDAEPRGNLLPTAYWSPEQQLTDRHGVLLPADLPGGTYRLVGGLYNLANGARLPVTGGEEEGADYVQIGEIYVYER
ncbi:MAG: glycosyltransferase family 39 protein [Anaerolineae bacterium]|nr:glycosyltransferase family 39 protein [Anaerolineae bacterium]